MNLTHDALYNHAGGFAHDFMLRNWEGARLTDHVVQL